MLRDREYEAATVLNGLPPMSNPIAVAEQSVLTSKRRRLGRVAVMISGTALAVTIWIAASVTVIPALNRGDANIARRLRTETMQLSCLSPQQAADIINPYVRSHGSTYYIPTTGISAITVRGTAEELTKSRNLIREFESDPKAACHVPGGSLLNMQDQPSLLKGEGNSAPHVAPDKVPTAVKTR
jgi:type II secretory pathway component GspD/PulD (secretin)